MKEKRFQIQQVLTLLTLTVFALCLLLVLLTGASAYGKLVDRGELAYGRRTGLQYLTTRLRQAEMVEIGSLEGCEALVLGEVIAGEEYTTHIYCYEGWLRELYAVPGAKLPPQAGEAILEAETFTLQQEGSLLRVQFGTDELLFHLTTGSEVGP